MSIQEDGGSRPTTATSSRRGPSRTARPQSSLNEAAIAHHQAGEPAPSRVPSRTSVPGAFEPENTIIIQQVQGPESPPRGEPGDDTYLPQPLVIRSGTSGRTPVPQIIRVGDEPEQAVAGPSRTFRAFGGNFFSPIPQDHGGVTLVPIRPPSVRQEPQVPQITGTITAAGPIPTNSRIGTPLVPAPPYQEAVAPEAQPSDHSSSSSSSSSSSERTEEPAGFEEIDAIFLQRHNATLAVIEGLRVAFNQRLTGLEQEARVLANNQNVFNISMTRMQETLTQILNATRNAEHNTFLVGQDIVQINNELRNTQGNVTNVLREVELSRNGQNAWDETINDTLEEARTSMRNITTRTTAIEEAITNMREELDEASQHGPQAPTPPEAESTLRDDIRRLEQRINRQGPVPAQRPKVTRPKAFDGKKGEGAEMFITQMESYFVRLGEQYAEDEERIREALANFKSDNRSATHWAQVLLRSLNNDEHNEHLQTWESFRAHFLEQFSDPNKKAKAEAAIKKCRQNNSVANYASEFRYILVDINWGEEAIIHQFKEGLKDEIKTELSRFELTLLEDDGTERTLSLDRWITIAINIDQKLQAIKAAKGGQRNPKPTSGVTTKRLPDTVYNARKTSGRCLKCGSSDHRLASCKEKEWKEMEPTIKGREGTIEETTESGKV